MHSGRGASSAASADIAEHHTRHYQQKECFTVGVGLGPCSLAPVFTAHAARCAQGNFAFFAGKAQAQPLLSHFQTLSVCLSVCYDDFGEANTFWLTKLMGPAHLLLRFMSHQYLRLFVLLPATFLSLMPVIVTCWDLHQLFESFILEHNELGSLHCSWQRLLARSRAALRVC